MEAESANDIAYISVEENKRFSESMLWSIHQEFFKLKGDKAWGEGLVPYYVTSNPLLAKTYAESIIGYFSDLLRQGLINTKQPVYILELGVGSGLFAFNFLRIFFNLLNKAGLDFLKVVYIMSDFTHNNIIFWRYHPVFKPFIKAKQLDFAQFDAEKDKQIKLINACKTLNSNTLANPLITIANYVFDSLKNDFFYCHERKLYESLVEVTVKSSAFEQGELDKENFQLSDVKLSYQRVLVNRNYYSNPKWNRMLDHYRQQFPEAVISFPVVALQCLQNLQAISKNRLLLLTADKGFFKSDAMLENKEPEWLVTHGNCFSMRVNYYAINHYFILHNGYSENYEIDDGWLQIAYFVIGLKERTNRLNRAFKHSLSLIKIPEMVATGYFSYPYYTLEEMLHYLKVSEFDSYIFSTMFPVLKEHLPKASQALKKQWASALQKVWQNYYVLNIANKIELRNELIALLNAIDYGHKTQNYYQTYFKDLASHLIANG